MKIWIVQGVYDWHPTNLKAFIVDDKAYAFKQQCEQYHIKVDKLANALSEQDWNCGGELYKAYAQVRDNHPAGKGYRDYDSYRIDTMEIEQ